ncbi:MAG: TatD family hydrolase [Mycoplasmataceae bacterium]|jgi:TatD DNase family protein|nr:TatD family hydrolase [Mycoplasmataceae bacterium]
MKYFDVHTHTNMTTLASQAEEIAIECEKLNISYIDIGSDVHSSSLAVQHAQKFSNVYACVGIHPGEINKIDISITINEITTLLETNKRIVAIGETGLDYHYEGYDANKQKGMFIEHIKLAQKFKLPLMVHIRDAHEDAIEILKKHATGLKVIIHCFSGDSDLVKKYINLHYFISINGIITFNSAAHLREAIKKIPLKRLLSETDAPWLSPEPFRGKINTPLNVPYVVKAMAKILNLSEEELASHLYKNATKLFLKSN